MIPCPRVFFPFDLDQVNLTQLFFFLGPGNPTRRIGWMFLSFEERYTTYTTPHHIRHTMHGNGSGSGGGIGRRASECMICAVCQLEAMTTSERSSRCTQAFFFFFPIPFSFHLSSLLFGFISLESVCVGRHSLFLFSAGFFFFRPFFLVISVAFLFSLSRYPNPKPKSECTYLTESLSFSFPFSFHFRLDFISTNLISQPAS